MTRALLLVLAVSIPAGFASGFGGAHVAAALRPAPPAPKPSLHAELCKSEKDPENRKLLCDMPEEKLRVYSVLLRMEAGNHPSEEIDKFQERARALMASRK